MSLARLLGLGVVVFALFVIISQPVSASEMAHRGLQHLRGAGDSAVTFLDGVVR